MRALRRHGRIVASNEQRVKEYNPIMVDQIMVVEIDGTVNRYKRVTDVVE
jgi:hypothetical protein